MNIPQDESERDALQELERLERWEALLASDASVSDDDLIKGLLDQSEPIRAEILDYILDMEPSENIGACLRDYAQRETAVQCVARLAFISHDWSRFEIRENIVYRPTIDEAEYILSWDYAGRAKAGDLDCLIKLFVQSYSDDFEMKTVARNLLLLIGSDGSEYDRLPLWIQERIAREQ